MLCVADDDINDKYKVIKLIDMIKNKVVKIKYYRFKNEMLDHIIVTSE